MDLKVVNNNTTIIKGTRSTSGDGLWDIPIPQNILPPKNPISTKAFTKITYPTPTSNSLNITLRTDKQASNLAAYLHAVYFSPVKHTFLNAIKQNFFLTWTGLTYLLIQKYPVVPQPTILGHIEQKKYSLCSTKPKLTQNKAYNKSNDTIYSIIQNSNRSFMDLKGRFPYKSPRGNEYILIAYHIDSNTILGTPVKNKQSNTMHGYTCIINLNYPLTLLTPIF